MQHLITYFEIAAFIASLTALPVLWKTRYLRLFPLLLFVIVAVEVQQTFFFTQGTNNAAIYNLQVPLQHVIYLTILYLAMERQSFRNFAAGSIVAFIVITVLTGLFLTQDDRFNIMAYSTGSILIIVGILLKFYEILANPVDYNFLLDPFFYLLFAFLIFNVGTLPYFTLSNWLYFIVGSEKISVVLRNVMSVFNYILYTTYTLVFIWMTVKAFSSRLRPS